MAPYTKSNIYKCRKTPYINPLVKSIEVAAKLAKFLFWDFGHKSLEGEVWKFTENTNYVYLLREFFS